ncbi:MAG: hypothetical protein LBQ12_08840 [Deltaproteobacteria bacterium]|jgi:tetratricopeptide (TPR) repeat protein|nr:hypothetical protein [Deltaproteobacteria bacterium]
MPEITTKDYWNQRYSGGMNSGAGSYGRLAEFKAEVLNGFIDSHGIREVAELGCGDGNQLGLLTAEQYVGYDISRKSVEICAQKYTDDPSKSFKVYNPSKPLGNSEAKAELSLSLDVVYHLLEDETYGAYMRDLFALSGRFVAIYSCNTENLGATADHLRPHRFTDWVEENLQEWTLCGYLPNRYPFRTESADQTSFADFYFFSKNERVDPKYSCFFIPPDEDAAGLPDDEAANLLRIARQCLNVRDYEKSAVCLRQAAANRGVRLNAVNSLGAVLGALGRRTEAEDAMKAVLARDPSNRQARLNLAKLYLKLERWKDLNPFCGELRELRSHDSNVALKWPHIAAKVENMG